jgi:hypothetical protein
MVKARSNERIAARPLRLDCLPVARGRTVRSLVLLCAMGSLLACGDGVRTHPETQPETQTPETDAGALESIEVALSGSGSGELRWNDTVLCTSQHTPCEGEVPAHEPLRLIARPDTGSRFAGWVRGCEQAEGPSCMLTAAGPIELEARFELLAQLDLVLDGPGRITQGGNVACSSDEGHCTRYFSEGSDVTLVAAPLGNAVFAGWSGDCQGDAESCALHLSGTRTVHARFTPFYTLSVELLHDPACQPVESGWVSGMPGNLNCAMENSVVTEASTCAATLKEDSAVALELHLQRLTVFRGWSGGCSGSGTHCNLQLQGDTKVVATLCGIQP